MKGSSDIQPETFVSTLGLIQFRYNITETVRTDMNEEERTEFQYDYVNVPDKERTTLISALVSDKYSAAAEIALVNNELLHSGTVEYAEYQLYRSTVKSVVDNALGNTTTTIPIPASVSMRQARLQLLALGLLTTVNEAIAAMSEQARIDWEYATDIQWANPLVEALAGLLGWADSDKVSYFIAASKL